MDLTLELKSQVYQQCQEILQKKLEVLDNSFREMKESLNSEAKSTAGDKHETGRAMIQLEQEKLSRQFRELQNSKSILDRIPYSKEFNTAQSGALVRTNRAIFFIAIGLGMIKVNETEVFVMGASSPLAQAMLGCKEGDHYSFQQNKVEVLEIV